jgi:hypothetical protein
MMSLVTTTPSPCLSVTPGTRCAADGTCVHVWLSSSAVTYCHSSTPCHNDTHTAFQTTCGQPSPLVQRHQAQTLILTCTQFRPIRINQSLVHFHSTTKISALFVTPATSICSRQTTVLFSQSANSVGSQ